MLAPILVSQVLAFLALLPSPARAQDVMALVHADRWQDADAAAARLADPVARRLVLFYRVLAPQAATLADIEAFRAQSPQWPLQATLLRRREEALAAEPDDAVALPACKRLPPETAPALARCAAAEARQANPDEAAADARAAWIAAPPDPAWEATFLPLWGSSLGPLEHWRRFDRAAWGDPAAASRLLPALSPEDRAVAEARLALRRDDPQAARLWDAVPEARRADPGLTLERLRWLRRAGRAAEALRAWQDSGAAAERAAPEPHRPSFWDERSALARRLLRDDDPAGAYALADLAAQSAPETVAEAEFLAGFIALRRLSDPVRARAHFQRLADLSSSALTRSRGLYWLARAAAASGDAAAAQAAQAAAAAMPQTYYGQLAEPDPGRRRARILASIDPPADRDRALAFSGQELARAAAWLVAWGEPRRAQAFLLRLAENAPDPATMAMAARLADGLRLPQAAVAVARWAGRNGVGLVQAGWPLAVAPPIALPSAPSAPAAPSSATPPPALVLAIMRQESSFDTDAVSPAGARGLMQLMPATAQLSAQRLGLPSPTPLALLDDPALNVRLGASYLAGLLGRFASPPLAAAAYNAGPARVAQWLADSGSPAPDPALDRAQDLPLIDWIELIPLAETRNYVQRVMENFVIYQAKLGETAEATAAWSHSHA